MMSNERLTDYTQQIEQERRATAAVALTLCRDSHISDVSDIPGEMRRRGFGSYAVKAAVDPLLSTDPALQYREPLLTAFIGAVDRDSRILSALQAAGAIVSPLPADSSTILIGTITAHSVNEQSSKPISEIAGDTGGIPIKAVATAVISAEAARAADPRIQDGIRRHLSSKVAAEVDVACVTQLAAVAAPAPSANVGSLLGAISDGQPERPVIFLGWESVGLLASELRDWQSMGVVIVPCAAASGQMIAVDARGVGIADRGAELSTARHATLAMTDDGSGTANFNLFQKNCVGVRAERWFSISIRPDAVAATAAGSPGA
jgi:hypothetical protein